MGNSNSGDIKINLDQNDLFHFTDEPISGKIILNIKEGKLEAHEIYLVLIGEIGYRQKIAFRNVAVNEFHHIRLYSSKMYFIKSKSEGKEIILNQGQYACPFQFSLPNDLPPTINQPESYPHVRYYLEVIIDKPWYQPDISKKKYLTIYPRANLLKNPQCLSTCTFTNIIREVISLKVTLNKLGYTPNELIDIIFEINNPNEIKIKYIDLLILQLYRIENNNNHVILFQAKLPNIINIKDQFIQEQFSFMIPFEHLSPSCQFRVGIQKLPLVNISYLLRLTVKVERMFNTFDFDIPITIGTRSSSDLKQQLTGNPLAISYSTNTDQSMVNDDDDDAPPPTYESVIQNLKSI